MLGIGIDFGTTNSTLAIFDGAKISYVDIDALSLNPSIMPTALYLNHDYIPTIGTRAILQYLLENEGRQIRLTRQELGEVEISYGELGMHQVAIHAYVDKDMPGQLFHGLKRWLGDPNLGRITVLQEEFRTVALITPILEHIRLAAEKALGEPIHKVHIGRPVNFEGQSTDSNQIALKRLREASENAEIPHARFYPEPLAASLGYLHGKNRNLGDAIVTFDFGGGTLDLSAIELKEDGFDILATHGVTIGGVKIDQEVFAAKIFPHLGKGAMVRSSPLFTTAELPFGFYPFIKDLLNWKNTHRLNTAENIRNIDYAIANSGKTTARRLRRLKTLILSNMSYTVHQSMEELKIELSENDSALIDLPDIDLNLQISRAEFENIIAQIMHSLADGVDILLDNAAIRPEDVAIVVRTGGSAQIPMVHRMLTSKFPGKVVEYDVFKSIAAGLAIANYHDYNFERE